MGRERTNKSKIKYPGGTNNDDLQRTMTNIITDVSRNYHALSESGTVRCI